MFTLKNIAIGNYLRLHPEKNAEVIIFRVGRTRSRGDVTYGIFDLFGRKMDGRIHHSDKGKVNFGGFIAEEFYKKNPKPSFRLTALVTRLTNPGHH